MNVFPISLFSLSSARWPALHLNRACHCRVTHGPARAGWKDGRMSTREEFQAVAVHRRALEVTSSHPVVGRKKRIKNGRANGPRGTEERGKVFQGGRWGIYVGTVVMMRPVREGCWR